MVAVTPINQDKCQVSPSCTATHHGEHRDQGYLISTIYYLLSPQQFRLDTVQYSFHHCQQMPNYESVNMISGKVSDSLKMLDDGRQSRRSFQSFIVLPWSSGASELQTPASVESALPLVQSPYTLHSSVSSP